MLLISGLRQYLIKFNLMLFITSYFLMQHHAVVFFPAYDDHDKHMLCQDLSLAFKMWWDGSDSVKRQQQKRKKKAESTKQIKIT